MILERGEEREVTGRLVSFLIVVYILEFCTFNLFAIYTGADRLSIRYFPFSLFFRAKFFFAFLKRHFSISSTIIFFGKG